MKLEYKPLAELTEEALAVLYGELGVVDTVRFLRQFSAGFGDYTVERSAQPDETLEEIIAAIKQRRTSDVLITPDDSPSPSEYQARLEQIKRQHPHAYEPWSDQEDEQLRIRYKAGASLQELSQTFGRQRSAILSCLRKLGLRTN